MGYNGSMLFDLGIVDVSNDQIMQNEISLGRWIVDALNLLLSVGESYDLAKVIPINQLSYSFIPNIFLPIGCSALGLQGSTVIEIRNNLLYETEIRQSQIFKVLVDDGIVDTLLIVYINSTLHSFPDNDILDRIRLIDANKFVKKAKDAIKAGKGGVNAALRDKRRKPNNPWETIREERLKIAINDFNRYDSVIFSGAGVSASAKIPDWQSLLKNLLANGAIFTTDDFNCVFKSADRSYLVTARYIEKALNADKKAIIQKIRQLLYPNNHQDESELIKVICKLIIMQKNLKSVITYNYDTLIEDCLRREGKPCFSVYKNNRDESNSFPVYMVQGGR